MQDWNSIFFEKKIPRSFILFEYEWAFSEESSFWEFKCGGNSHAFIKMLVTSVIEFLKKVWRTNLMIGFIKIKTKKIKKYIILEASGLKH